MRKFHLIYALSLALGAAPYSSAQQQVLPSHFSSWTCSPGAEDVEFDRIPNFSDLTKEAGLAENEFCDYFSCTAEIHVDLQTYSDPSSAYEMYTALIRPDMHPSTLDKTSSVDGDRLFVLAGSSILQMGPKPPLCTACFVSLLATCSERADQTPLPPIRT